MKKSLDLENVKIYSNNRKDIIEAMDHIGEEVYLSEWVNFSSYVKDKLTRVIYAVDDRCPYWCSGENSDHWGYQYAVLAKDVKTKEEKKLRPYKDISEFCVETGCEEVGTDIITIKNKHSKQESILLYTGYSKYAVHLGGYVITFKDLLNNYEYALNSFEWLPFGVEE